MPDAETYVRLGFCTITPYLTVRGAEAAVAFMVATFDAVVIRRDPHDDGTLMNAETNLGDSLPERSEARGEWAAMPGTLHVYVRDTAATFRRALAAGGVERYPRLICLMASGARGCAMWPAMSGIWRPIRGNERERDTTKGADTAIVPAPFVARSSDQAVSCELVGQAAYSC